ncbi:MAG: tRNA (N(6)-L-threonylcarbamoyladenosine(37)-C(2))-methylthiotransferase MtaB [Acidaminococcaceae bacterium]|nr:tRNA (N(6)-L-threonylcarbamoyladenosine(37)-C(2))-methylthiotransferase MtaB [Acidaminococcaceae bacterium]
MKSIAFMTLGCKVNQADTASMQELFRQAGYEVCEFTDSAEIYVVNTCVVTNTGQQKSRQMIRRAIRKENDALIVVTGCYPQTAAEEVKAIDGVDLIIGTQDRAKIVELVEAALGRKQAIKKESDVAAEEKAKGRIQSVQLRTSAVDDEVRPWGKDTTFEEMSGGNEADKTRAYLKIQEGCNQYCSYCIIPYARGPLRSRGLQNIKEEVQRLTEAGYKEIVLIGIHLGCYGKEMKDGTTLYDAVKAALSVPALQRLRLGSLESVEVEERLLDLMTEDKRLCPHLHLPLQSGCDKILKDMHRPYETNKFKSLLETIRDRIPGIAITTDVIVGFPGETEDDFATTCRFVKQCAFAKMHIFPYSMRRGTPAAARKDQVPEAIKKQRAEKLAELDREMQRSYFEANVGTVHTVLVEQPVTTENAAFALVEGLTDNYIRVEVSGNPGLCGEMVQVRITEALIDKCRGIIL